MRAWAARAVANTSILVTDDGEASSAAQRHPLSPPHPFYLPPARSMRAVAALTELRACLDPEKLALLGATCAVLLAAALGARLLHDHVLELGVMLAAAAAAWALYSRQGSAGSGNDAPACDETVLAVSADDATAAFKAAFAVGSCVVMEEMVTEELIPEPFAQATASLPSTVAVLPVDAVSAYNEAYSATVSCVVFSAAGVALCVAARGDGSEGPLQNAEQSELCATTPAGEVRAAGPCRVTLHAGNTEDACRCVLHYPCGVVGRGDALTFTFGTPSGGYAPALLCTLDDACVEEHGLQALL